MADALDYEDIMRRWKRTPEQAANDLERYLLTGEEPDPGCLALAITMLRSELEPIRYAHWVPEKRLGIKGLSQCPLCGGITKNWLPIRCPHCGAKMAKHSDYANLTAEEMDILVDDFADRIGNEYLKRHPDQYDFYIIDGKIVDYQRKGEDMRK